MDEMLRMSEPQSGSLTSALQYPEDLYRVFYGFLYYLLGGFVIRNFVGKALARRLLPRVKENIDRGLEDKFLSTLCKLTNFVILLGYGIYTLYNEEWIWHPNTYAYDFPKNNIPSKIRTYYLMEFTSYLYASLAMVWEPKMKDFHEMIAHHTATLFLIASSYHFGFLRYGVIVMILHDVSDPFMEIAKLFFYSGAQAMANIFFAIFAAVFIFSRDFVYPYCVVATVFSDYLRTTKLYKDGACPYFVLIPTALCILQFLHLIWTGMILKMVVETFKKNGVQGDIREE